MAASREQDLVTVGGDEPVGLPAEVTANAASARAVQEKVQEYGLLVAPVERALRELQLTRGMLRARVEEEIHNLSPALAALAETLDISTLDLLMAADRAQFLRDAVEAARVPVDEVRRRLIEAGVGSGEQLTALGLPEAA